jgi:putative DNA primase/helicase
VLFHIHYRKATQPMSIKGWGPASAATDVEALNVAISKQQRSPTLKPTTSQQQNSAILKAALFCASRGWAVFPATPDFKKSFKCAEHSNGVNWGATRDPGEIRHDFTRWPDARIRLPTGAGNSIVVIETDTVEGHGVDGAASRAAIEAKHGPLPDTLRAISPSGSDHRYFRHPGDGIKIKSSASLIGSGIDVRGDGGMVIAPPSVNPDGRSYRWLDHRPLASMPKWLIDLTREKPRAISQRAIAGIRPFTGPSNYGTAALAAEIKNLAGTPPGTRNHILNSAAFSLYQLVGGGELDAGEVERRLIEAATVNGLVDDVGIRAVQATIASGRRAGLAHPRSRAAR